MMKKQRLILLVVLCTLCLTLLFNVTAAADADFETVPVDDHTTYERVAQNLRPLTAVPNKDRVNCFDVNENGAFVVGTGMFTKRKICVYDSAGEYQYGFQYDANGGYAVGWKGDHVLIYSVRSDLVTEIDADGTVLDVSKIQQTDDVDMRWHYVEYAKKKSAGDYTYILKGRSKILKETQQGAQVLYKTSPLYQLRLIVLVLAGIGVFVLAGFYAVAQTKKHLDDAQISLRCQQLRKDRKER